VPPFPLGTVAAKAAAVRASPEAGSGTAGPAADEEDDEVDDDEATAVWTSVAVWVLVRVILVEELLHEEDE